MKKYVIRRDGASRSVSCTVQETNSGRVYPLRHVVLHSPTGFNFGYLGSGPADLALSILCDYFDEFPTREHLYEGKFKAQPHYQTFKTQVIAFIDDRGRTITSSEIARWLASREKLGIVGHEHLAVAP